MSKLNGSGMMFWVLGFAAFCFYGCSSIPVRYGLNEKDIYFSKSMKSLKIQIAIFSDKREDAEKVKSARKIKGDNNLNDYTYDKRYSGVVAEEVTEMLIEHLNYSKVFTTKIDTASLRSDQISNEVLDSLHKIGIDGLIVGDITHFYGYYDINTPIAFLIALGTPIGIGWFMAEGLLEGDIAKIILPFPIAFITNYIFINAPRHQIKHVQISTRMISTSTYQPLWEDNFEVFTDKKEKGEPGTSNVILPIVSLREVVNQMVKSLESATITK